MVATASFSQQAIDVSDSSLPVEKISNAATTDSKVARKCNFCGQLYHVVATAAPRMLLAIYAKNLSIMQESIKTKTRQILVDFHILLLFLLQPRALLLSVQHLLHLAQESLLQASLSISISGNKLTALINSGSSESYVTSEVCKTLTLEIHPSERQVQMVSSTTKIKSYGFCVVNVKLKDASYNSAYV